MSYPGLSAQATVVYWLPGEQVNKERCNLKLNNLTLMFLHKISKFYTQNHEIKTCVLHINFCAFCLLLSTKCHDIIFFDSKPAGANKTLPKVILEPSWKE